jgi:hypothetical protein
MQTGMRVRKMIRLCTRSLRARDFSRFAIEFNAEVFGFAPKVWKRLTPKVLATLLKLMEDLPRTRTPNAALLSQVVNL